MAELVGGALLSASLEFLFERIGSGEVLSHLRGKSKSTDLDEVVAKLKIVLNSVQAVIEDAEEKQRRSKRVEAWLDMLQEALLDAEDLLDVVETDSMQLKGKAESSAGETKIRSLLKGKKKKLWDFFLRSRSSDDGDMGSKLEKLLERMEYIASQKDLIGLKEGTSRERPSWRLPSTSLVDESEVFGRECEKGEIIKLLGSDNVGSGKICTIPIVGMGGVGKTTLAQFVFNDPVVVEHFELRAWVSVSEELDVCRVTKTILEEVKSSACDATGLNLLQVRLKESLTGKKFLIVLDDVWCEKSADLSVMCLPFKHGAQGSKIIVTTRSENVASIMGTVQTHNLRELSKEACWQLFVNEASGIQGDFSANEDLENIAREIVKKCKGLPLALKTLGCLLHSTLDVGQWKRVLESDIWDLREDESNILPALKLSYHYLPSQLKRCFAYCSIFPKDYEFKKDELILLWMAENFLESPKRNRRMEDVGEEYFHGLLSRSFFQRSSTLESFSQDTEPIFVMHDLIHDLAKSISGEYCLHLENGMPIKINVKKVRHVAYIPASGDRLKRFSYIFQSSNIRTFLSLYRFGYCTISMVSIEESFKFRFLKVLSLARYINVFHLPDTIGELRSLRYLDLSYTGISWLPESTCKLLNLQTLKLNNCVNLIKLPKGMHHLVNLRYLELFNSLVEVPAQLSKLKNLQRLSIFIVGIDGGTKIGELGELSHLRGELSIQKLENVGNVKDALNQAKLMDKEHLETVKLYWSHKSTGDPEHAKDVLEMLLPSRTLKKLHIYGYSGKEFSHWLGSDSLGNIVFLKLLGCRNCLSLPPLGQLPSLKILEISEFDALVDVGREFYGHRSGATPFPSLEILKFRHMSSWEKWSHPDFEIFPEIKELVISDCTKLTGDFPPCFPSLTKLNIFGCEALASPFPRMPHVELVIWDCNNLLHTESFIEALRQMKTCQRIYLTSCSSSIPIPIECLPATLKLLHIEECENFEFQWHRPQESVEVLKMKSSCNSVLSFPLDSFPKARELIIQRLKNLESLSIPTGLKNLTSLSSLHIEGCHSFVSFPEGGLVAPNLTRLVIKDCERLKTLPDKIHSLLTSLDYLEINNCPEIESIPETGLPISLSNLIICCCDKLTISLKNWHLDRLLNLTVFDIRGSSEDVKSFPEEGLLPVTITHLRIGEFPCLKSLDQNGLRRLISLEQLDIYNLPMLHTLPGEVLSNSLRHLQIASCDGLQTIPGEALPASLNSLEIFDCGELQTIYGGLPTSLEHSTISYCPKLKIIEGLKYEWAQG